MLDFKCSPNSINSASGNNKTSQTSDKKNGTLFSLEYFKKYENKSLIKTIENCKI